MSLDGLKKENTYPIGQKLGFFILSLLPPDDPEPKANQTKLARAVYTLIMPSLIETLLLLGTNGIAAYFLEKDTPWYKNPLFASCLYVVINSSLRATSYFTQELDIPDGFLVRQTLRAVRSVFNALGMSGATTLLHEAGHILGTHITCLQPNPKLSIKGGLFSTSGGEITFDSSQLSNLGLKLGKKESQALITVMGPGLAMLINLFGLIAAQALPETQVEAKSFLRTNVLYVLIQHIIYAISGYGDCKDSGNDFCQLKDFGVSPLLMIMIMLSAHLMTQLTLSGLDAFCKKPLEQARITEDDIEEEDELALQMTP